MHNGYRVTWGKKGYIYSDKYLAQNIAKETDIEIITWDNGSCEANEPLTPEDLIEARDLSIT